ncbi:MAG TPA: hypothetical protein VK148_08960 [Xanthobacteraceae bacterium]|jgi:hypothetical protein|nr:hypothetical protein [Xanthobacteraceae bacterium]
MAKGTKDAFNGLRTERNLHENILMERVMKADRAFTRNNTGQVLSTNEARQGVTGHNVRYVLGFGLLGVIIAFGIIAYLSAEGFITPILR